MDVLESMLVNYGMHRPSRDDRKRFTITQNCSPGSYAIAKYRGRLYSSDESWFWYSDHTFPLQRKVKKRGFFFRINNYYRI